MESTTGNLRSQNDQKALELIKKIEEKKSQLKSVTDLSWKTNCKFSIPTITTTNLQTINDLHTLQVAFAYIIQDRNSIEEAGKMLNINTNAENTYKFGDFTFEQWQHDFKNRSLIIQFKADLKKLEEAKKIVESRISEDKKNEIELDNLSKELGI